MPYLLPNMASVFGGGLKALELRYLVVAGGGGAGGGGGGGGGVLQGVVTIKKGETWKVKVGKGGDAGQGGQIWEHALIPISYVHIYIYT